MRKRDRMRAGDVTLLTSWNYPLAQVTPFGKEIIISVFHEKGQQIGPSLAISRRLARMLAKRINQALDASK